MFDDELRGILSALARIMPGVISERYPAREAYS